MLRAVIGFDHIAKNVLDTWLPTSGYGLTKTATGTIRGLMVNADGALQCNAIAGNSPVTQSILDFTRYFQGPITTFTLGIRIKQIVAGNTGPLLYLVSDPGITATMLLLNNSSLPGIGTVGTETYLEMLFDLTAGTVSYWFDEVFLTTSALTGVSLANLRNGIMLLATNHGSVNTLGVCSIKDIYLTDNIPGDGYIGRIGPRKAYPISIDSAAGVDWTASDGGGLLATLNTPIETAGATITSGASKAALTASLSSTVPAGAIVEGISLFAASKVDVISSLTNVKLVNGAKSIDGGSKAFTTTLKYGNPLGAFARDPSGARWTAASIDSTSVVLTPDVAS